MASEDSAPPSGPNRPEMEVRLAVAHQIVTEMTVEQRELFLLHLSVSLMDVKPELYFFLVDKIKEE